MVLLFALAGAWVSAAYMPALLEYIFLTVARANMPTDSPGLPSKPTKPMGDAKPIEPVESGAQATGGEQATTGGESTGQGAGSSSTTGSSSNSNGTKPDSEPGSSKGADSKSVGPIIVQREDYPDSSNPAILAAMALLGAIVGGAIGNVLVTIWQKSVAKWDKLELGDKVSLFIGIFAGIVASTPFFLVFQGLGGVLAPLLTLALVLGFSAVSILALRSMEEVLPWTKNKGVGKRTGRKLLDTNVIIDGRILDVARTGFIEGEIYVPKFVIDEMQYIADSPDALRRQRGRRGLEVLRLLQADYNLTIGTEDEKVAQTGEVDDRLVQLAKALGGDIVSNDFNLNRVAGLQNVKVLNINDLALSLRPNVLPGEHLTVPVIREGSQVGQGIGYLDDGTMVVVDSGKHFIGETVDTIVTQVIQTERGKMIFADNAVSMHPSKGANGR